MDAQSVGRDLDRIIAAVPPDQVTRTLRMVCMNLAGQAGQAGERHLAAVAGDLARMARRPAHEDMRPLFDAEVTP